MFSSKCKLRPCNPLCPAHMLNYTQSWVLFASRRWNLADPEVQALRPLVPLAMAGFQHEQMYDVVINLFAEIMDHFPDFLSGDDFRNLSMILTSNDAHNKISQLKAGDFDEDTMGFVRLLLTYAEAKIGDLAKNPHDAHYHQILCQILDLMKCDGYGGVDEEVCSQAMEFWQLYVELVVDATEDETPPWLGIARQQIKAVVEACWAKAHWPPHEIVTNWDADTKSSFNHFRNEVSDLLQSTYKCLGSEVFWSLIRLAIQSLHNHAWLPCEASMYCLTGLADIVAEDRSLDGALSELFASSLFPDVLNPGGGIPARTQRTVVDLINSYTAFFKRHTEYLPGMLNFLFGSLNSPDLAHLAAKTILSTCSSCRKALTSEVDAFLLQYETLRAMDEIDIEVQAKLTGAVSAVIQALPEDNDKVAPLTRLVQAVERDVQRSIQASQIMNSPESAESGLRALKCFESMANALQAPDEAVIDLETEPFESTFWIEGPGNFVQIKVIRVLETVTSIHAGYGDVIESACQILRAGYKEKGGLFVFPYKITLSFILASKPGTARLDCVLETARRYMISRTSTIDSTLINVGTLFVGHMIELINYMKGK